MSFVFLYKLLIALWPFIKEWVFGGKSIQRALKESRMYTILKLATIVLVFSTAYFFWRSVDLGMDVSNYRAQISKIERTCGKTSNSTAATGVIADMQDVNRYLQCRETDGECD